MLACDTWSSLSTDFKAVGSAIISLRHKNEYMLIYTKLYKNTHKHTHASYHGYIKTLIMLNCRNPNNLNHPFMSK